MANAGLGTGSASVTSMNYVGFEELKGQGVPPSFCTTRSSSSQTCRKRRAAATSRRRVRPRAAVVPEAEAHHLEYKSHCAGTLSCRASSECTE